MVPSEEGVHNGSATGSSVVEQDASIRVLVENALAQQYEIIRPLGSGGMGSVFLARERALERFVAIKVLRPELALTESNRERFRREARIVARLSHPSILGLHTFGEIDHIRYFVMNYVRGETLAERVRREGPMPWADAHRVFMEMADALDCAHTNGVIHRDIKPANILIDSESGHAILADFGISKLPAAADSLTATGAVVGTPDYMSPEQITGASDLDERSDIYSLGAVAYTMLTGREPFRTETGSSTLYRRIIEDPTPVEQLVPRVPASLASVVRKCLARDRSDRWTNAQMLKAALANIMSVDGSPEIVRELRGYGPYALVWALGFLGFAFLSDRSLSESVLLILLAFIAPIGLVLHVWNGAAPELRFVDVARMALWPPVWWTMWWPNSLRRQSDLWWRLPPVARAVRIILSASYVVLFSLIVSRGRIAAEDAAWAPWVSVAQWGVVAGATLAVVLAFFWARRKGLTFTHSQRLLLGPTVASASWRDPAFKRVLTPTSVHVSEPEVDSPSDYLRAIRELIPAVAETDGETGRQTTITAERVLKAIDERDSELATLLRNAGPVEIKRLASQLDGLDSPGLGDTDDRRELRELVRHQMALVHRMQDRREIVVREREHLVDVLRSLWVLVRAAGESGDDARGTLARIQRMCADVRLELGSASVL